MSLRFPYQLEAMQRSIPSLGGRWVRPRPIVRVSVIGPAGTRLLEAHLDSAADDTIFPERIASIIGIDLTMAPTGIAAGVSTVAFPVRYAEVALRIADVNEQREWRALVGFTPARLKRSL